MRFRIRHALGAAVALALSLRADSSRAQIPVIPVFDFSRWTGMVLMLRDVQHLTEQAGASLAQIQNAAAGLGGGNLVNDILIEQRYLTGDLQSIGYSIDTVTSQFEAVFPSQKVAANVPPSDVATLRNQWDGELQQSSLAAARAQTSLSRMDSNTQAALQIMERSKATTGGTDDQGSQLAKLQALVQMLGVVNSDVTTLATTLAASERVNADVAAAEAADQDLSQQQAERMLRDYTQPGPIPEIDPRLLRE